MPAAAVVAATADDGGHDRDAVADADVADAPADLDHPGGELVPERLRQRGAGQRVRRGRRDDRSDGVLVQVGAADAAVAGLR